MMKTGMRWMTVIAALASLAIARGEARSGEVAGQASGTAKAQAAAGKGSIAADADARAEAEARAQVRKRLETIKEKGAKTSVKARAAAETQLDAMVDQVNGEAETGADAGAKVAERLAAEFDMTAEALLEQKEELDASWGELTIAHTLDANAASEVTVEELFQLRSEGAGWGQIAAGLGLNLGEVVSAMRAESRVASGLARADGRVHVIHGAGARAGVATGAAVGAGAKVQAGVQAGASVPRIKVGKP